MTVAVGLDPASIDVFAKILLDSDRPLHLLINNAGIMAAPLVRDARGYESHFSANHPGHFHLTARLWPALVRAGGARVVTLSSGAHRQAAMDFDDPNFEHRDYDKRKAYGQSKTANVLFTVVLDQKGEPHGVRAFAVHPGRTETNLHRFITMEKLQARGVRNEQGEFPAEQRGLYKTPQQGAATTIWCAVSPALDGMGGVYCENCDIAQAVPADHGPLDGVLPWAIDGTAAERGVAVRQLVNGGATVADVKRRRCRMPVARSAATTVARSMGNNEMNKPCETKMARGGLFNAAEGSKKGAIGEVQLGGTSERG